VEIKAILIKGKFDERDWRELRCDYLGIQWFLTPRSGFT